ncbi:hypothetical protein GO755_34775 [Spirosoma sp. HMF4905]|uniref:Phage tail protein n=1 Tax=Spirosoma arboris TaxID=2682092 RepID=A0A7K1SN63_9BACT|nr:hypothetical protein [Spirosoma arboris]MVM35238.1 hypothetical protein [Spirosoma arboris]
MSVIYSINGVLFSQFGVIVSGSDGILDGLELKDPFTVEWPDAHGEVVDLTRPRYKPRQIKLDCCLVATDEVDFVSKVNAMEAQFLKSETQRLSISVLSAKPMVYEIYMRSGISIKKKWRQGKKMFGQFTLELTEPQPIKYTLVGAGATTATITITAVTPVKLHWGDGSVTIAQGTNQTYTHNYGGSSGVLYYLIIAGELERFTEHSKTNLTVLWPRLY